MVKEAPNKGTKSIGHKLNPFEQGMRDAQAGRTVNGSPFSRHSREWVRWFSGWQSYYCNQHRKMVTQ